MGLVELHGVCNMCKFLERRLDAFATAQKRAPRTTQNWNYGNTFNSNQDLLTGQHC